ncbi:protein CDV3 homolog isoform X2 [Pollicipes pollicipes]|uniref:protein CDV3 homolog isoform X2 n=1 Tax=Pollicipes pollicipes TaxID=41117 RepID=UPI001885609F|nr:protein CDV3 homolog isoform X2 [Pollicipes pollicipes]
MADLADFFAKKDKKKTKPKKFVPEDMGKKLEEAEKKQQERERREELKREHLREEQLEIDDPNHKKEPADEWQDEEEATVDLSDLNIQQLEQPEAGRAEGEVGPLDADGNPTGAQGSAWGWQKTEARDQSPEEREPEPVKPPEPVAAPEPTKAAAASTSSVGYVPPHRRNMPAASATPSGPLAPTRLGATRSWRNKAPDISSDEAFPTLGAAVEETARGAWGQRGARPAGQDFQRVRHGNTSGQDSRLQAPKLSLGNQFDALQLNDAY